MLQVRACFPQEPLTFTNLTTRDGHNNVKSLTMETPSRSEIRSPPEGASFRHVVMKISARSSLQVDTEEHSRGRLQEEAIYRLAGTF